MSGAKRGAYNYEEPSKEPSQKAEEEATGERRTAGDAEPGAFVELGVPAALWA